MDLLHRTPLVPWCVCGLMSLLLWRLLLPQPQRLMRARLAVVTLMRGRVCRLGFGRTRWRFLGGIRPLASVGLFDAHRSVAAAVDGCPPPAVRGPSHLGSVAHIGGFDHAIFYFIFLFFVPATHRWPHCAHSVALHKERRAVLVPGRVSVCTDKAFHHYDPRCK